MDARKRMLTYHLEAFLLLFFVLLYRQISLKHMPADPLRTYILFGCYVLLLGLWAYSICRRVTQRSMRAFLIAEDVCKFIGLAIQFVQDTYLSNNIYLLRVTGLLVATTLLPLMTLGVFASLCIGRENSYRISKKWYLLLIPSVMATPLLLTDNLHHFFTYIIPEEPQPNLTYHPNVGFYLLAALILGMAVVRVILIYRRNGIMNDRPLLRRIVPFMEMILLLVFYLPYIINWLQVDAPIAPPEVIEQYSKIYYIEAITWEIYIFLGLVPVNMDYREIFEKSTLGLQIRGTNGDVISSQNAAELDEVIIEELEKKGTAEVPEKELRSFSIDEAKVVWTKDVSQLRDTIEALSKSAEELAQEGALLSEEIKTRNEAASLQAQNEIYDVLTREVQVQLQMIKRICARRGRPETGKEDLRKLAVLGTYVKRRCNLRLIERESGRIDPADLKLSLKDLLGAIALSGTATSLNWETEHVFSPRFSIAVFDMIEAVMERSLFKAETLKVSAEKDTVTLAVSGAELSGAQEPGYQSGLEILCRRDENEVILSMREAVG